MDRPNGSREQRSRLRIDGQRPDLIKQVVKYGQACPLHGGRQLGPAIAAIRRFEHPLAQVVEPNDRIPYFFAGSMIPNISVIGILHDGGDTWQLRKSGRPVPGGAVIFENRNRQTRVQPLATHFSSETIPAQRNDFTQYGTVGGGHCGLR